MPNRTTAPRRDEQPGYAPPPGLPPIASASPRPAKTRRRPAVMAAGVALVCLGGLLAAWLATSTTHAVAVLVTSRDIQAGDTITAQDLRIASLTRDPAVQTVPGSQQQQIVGQHAAVPLTAGQLLTPDSVIASLVPPAGTSLVGVAVGPTQLPSEPMQGGQQILIVPTASAQDDPRTVPPGEGIRATVVSTGAIQDTDKTIINVTVATQQAPALASQVATGRIAVIVLPPGSAS